MVRTTLPGFRFAACDAVGIAAVILRPTKALNAMQSNFCALLDNLNSPFRIVLYTYIIQHIYE